MAEYQQKRQTARKLWIKDILVSTYVKEEGMKPNHVVLQDNSRAARVNVMGVVVSKSEEGLPTLMLDDSTGKIVVRAFEENKLMSIVQIGDPVLVIGRPRQFGNEMYILPEVVRKLSDIGWFELRKLELGSIIPLQKSEVVEEAVVETSGITQNVIGVIRSLDEGQGADTDAVIQRVDSNDAEKTIQFLLQNGDVFEISPGKLKILE